MKIYFSELKAQRSRIGPDMCKHRVDQHLTVLKLYSISIDKILVTELMTMKVSEKLNSIQK